MTGTTSTASVLIELGPVPDNEVWDWQRHAVAGVVLAHGEVQDNESSKIYYYLRTELPTITEAPVPNRWLIEETGLGAVVPLDDVDAMADAAASVRRPRQVAQRRRRMDGSRALVGRARGQVSRAVRGGRAAAPVGQEADDALLDEERGGTIVLLSPGLDERAVWGERIVLGSVARALPRAFPGARVELLGVNEIERLPRAARRPGRLAVHRAAPAVACR